MENNVQAFLNLLVLFIAVCMANAAVRHNRFTRIEQAQHIVGKVGVELTVELREECLLR